MKAYPEDVRQAITEANHLLACEDEAQKNRPPGDWVDCACRIYWSHDSLDQHLIFCTQHAPHAARFVEELHGDALPKGIQKQSIADLVAQAAQVRGEDHGQYA